MDGQERGQGSDDVSEPEPKQLSGVRTFSRIQDRALAICWETQQSCPLGCTRDGAPNCHYYVSQGQCAPGRRALAIEERR